MGKSSCFSSKPWFMDFLCLKKEEEENKAHGVPRCRGVGWSVFHHHGLPPTMVWVNV